MMAAQLQQQASGAASAQPSTDRTTEGKGLDTNSSTKTAPMRNRAGDSRSPYVRSQAETPVLWQLLDDEALSRAKAENKLIFMHIGFLACHYCRLTKEDSFSNKAVASLLNESFIPIVIDREERPDIDAIYWNYIQLVNSNAGWPINVFLTPELKPVFGGTYWPGPGSDSGTSSDEETGDESPDFLGILQRLQKAWAEREAQCRSEAADTLLKLRAFAAEGTQGLKGSTAPDNAVARSDGNTGLTERQPTNELELDLDHLEEACTHLLSTFDSVNGGFGQGPKFITPAKFSFLLRLAHFPETVRDVIGDKEVSRATDAILRTLRRIRDGGLHDHVGAGFARLSATADWTLPQFEKMTMDNALLLNLYLDAWLASSGGEPSKDGEFADVVYELAEYLTSPPIYGESGIFGTSEAGDSYLKKGDREMREGAYYVWTRREFDVVVGGQDSNSSLATSVPAAYWNVLDHGNVDHANDPWDEFLNQNILHVNKDAAEVGRQFGIPPEEVKTLVAEARKKLAAHREKERPRPPTDEKSVTSINGMVIAALSRVGATLKYGNVDVTAGEKYIAAAKKAAEFIRRQLWDAEKKLLYRVYDGVRGDTQGFAEDYAFLIEGLLELYQSDADESWLKWADELQKTQIDLFYDTPSASSTSHGTIAATHSDTGAFYSTTQNAPNTILRLKDGMDTSQPSVNGTSVSNLFRLGEMLSDAKYKDLARETILAFEVEMLQHPWLFPSLLSGVVTARLGGELAVIDGQGGLAKFFTTPRAGLRCLIYVKGTGDSWVETRNPKGRKFLRA